MAPRGWTRCSHHAWLGLKPEKRTSAPLWRRSGAPPTRSPSPSPPFNHAINTWSSTALPLQGLHYCRGSMAPFQASGCYMSAAERGFGLVWFCCCCCCFFFVFFCLGLLAISFSSGCEMICTIPALSRTLFGGLVWVFARPLVIH